MWFFLSVIIVALAALGGLHMVLRQKRWTTRADYDFLKDEIAKCQRALYGLEKLARATARQVGIKHLDEVLNGKPREPNAPD